MRCSLLQECTEEEAADARQLLKELWRANKRATSEEQAEAFLTNAEMDTRWVACALMTLPQPDTPFLISADGYHIYRYRLDTEVW